LIIFFIFAPIPVLFSLIRHHNYTFFYQFFIPESIAWACGKGFLFPASPIIEFGKFATGSVFSFDCSFINTVNFLSETGFYYKTQPYLTWLVAICWRIFGTSYNSLFPIVYILCGAYISGIYMFSRQFLNWTYSALIALFIVLSPLSSQMVSELRDFSKAPFFIWALFFLFCLFFFLFVFINNHYGLINISFFLIIVFFIF
jgi:hypothetical protein